MNNEDLKNIACEFFDMQEFANSKSNNRIVCDLDLIWKLNELRKIVGYTDITSGYRTPAFNATCGGSDNSYHLEGKAADIRFDFKGWTKTSLTKVLQYLGFTNVNFYWDGERLDRLHVDIGKTWNGKEFNYRDLKA